MADALDRKFRVALPSYVAHGRAGWNGGPIGGGLAAEPGGYDLKSLAATGARDVGLSIRTALLAHIAAQGGSIGVATGGRKDGRVTVLSPEGSSLRCQ